MPICSGRVLDNQNGRFTFFNHLGRSVIDYILESKDNVDRLSDNYVCLCFQQVIRPRSNSFHNSTLFTEHRITLQCLQCSDGTPTT